jgi:purine-binding chemotaxis protein CheW
MTPVPRAHQAIVGLLNLRGQLVLGVDLRRRLNLAPRADDLSASNVVVRSEGAIVSLLVDEIGDVIEVDERRFEGAPQTLDERAKAFIRGVYKLDDRILLALDIDKTVSSAELNVMQTGPKQPPTT